MNERDAYIILNRMERVGPITVRRLKESLGSVSAILAAGEGELTSVQGVGRETAMAILEQTDVLDPEAETDRAAAEGVRIFTPVDPEYPKQLLAIHDPPLALYVQGEIRETDRNAIAIVGTRRPTMYGREMAERFGFQLSKCGFTIVSGLALGIDTAAHRGALKAGGRTLAVIAGGLDCLYPESNKELAAEIATSGAVITEYPFGRQPDRTTFPVRNRIVSGLSTGVLVVEAGLQSGALITTRQALDQGRFVFAVPGRIDSYASQGPHDLIKHGAKLAGSVDDILAEYEFLIPNLSKPAEGGTAPAAHLSDEEGRVMTLLEDGESDVDTLIRRSGIAPGTMNAMLIALEMKKRIRMRPGRVVEPIGRAGIPA